MQSSLYTSLQALYASVSLGIDMPVLEVAASELLETAEQLCNREEFLFSQLSDLCGIDYLHYGQGQWCTETATATGFSRAVADNTQSQWRGARFAVVYHLLSVKHNFRLRLRVRIDDLDLPSVTTIWPAANWYEREAYDLFGINFIGHPDLRRLLTDYDFQGHPFRKDFPLVGEVEMRFDATLQRCVYEPVTIKNRVLVPRVIRDDNRYAVQENPESEDASDGGK